MKKIAIWVMGLVLSISLCACACTNTAPATTPSSTNSTNNAMPTETMTIPVPETNIPDPSVDTTLPGGTPDGGNGTTGRSNMPPM